MRTIELENVGDKLIELITEDDPVEEDIGILEKDGRLLCVIIKKDAYGFFLKKVEEEEDRQDLLTVKEWHQSGEKNQ